MKNVWKIFQRDMMRVRNNVIALVVIIGISVVSLPVCVVQYCSQLGSVFQHWKSEILRWLWPARMKDMREV